MSQDYGVLITAPGTAVAGAPTNKILLNTSQPLMKLDTQNPVAFQTITLLITNNPPEPATSSSPPTYTVLYKYKHGYSYVPSIETLVNVVNPPPSASQYQQLFMDQGTIGQISAAQEAYLFTEVDNTFVYYIVQKTWGLFGTLNLSGTNLQITTHCFLNDIGV